MDVRLRKIVNVETASRGRLSVHEIGANPFFHANMYLHLQVPQVCNITIHKAITLCGLLRTMSYSIALTVMLPASWDSIPDDIVLFLSRTTQTF